MTTKLSIEQPRAEAWDWKHPVAAESRKVQRPGTAISVNARGFYDLRVLILIACTLAFSCGWAASNLFSPPGGGAHTSSSNSGPTVFSLSDLQTQLKEKGYYKGDVDGKYGPQTKAAWERWYADSMAVEYYREASK